MSEALPPARTAAEVLRALLHDRPDALVMACGDDGMRLPVPEALPVRDSAKIPLPEVRATALDLVLESDQLAIVGAWEEVRKAGVGVATVHLRRAPRQAVTMTFVDQRTEHGVIVAVFADASAGRNEAAQVGAEATVARRPRSATLRKNRWAVISEIDVSVTRMLGWTSEEIVGMRSSELIHPDDQERAIANWLDMLTTETGRRVRLRHRARDGSWIWTEIDNEYVAAPDADDVVVIATITDIADEMAAHEAVRQREQLFARLAESLPQGILQIDETGGLVFVNGRLPSIIGVDEVVGIDTIVRAVVDGDRVGMVASLEGVLAGGPDESFEVGLRMASSRALRRCAVVVVAVEGQCGGRGALLSITDVTESSILRDELRRQATFDALTGCYNRATILTELSSALTDDSEGTSLVFIDLDDFKVVNDSHGHAAGDELLVRVADLLRMIAGPDDSVGRLGGDEFIVVCKADAYKLTSEIRTHIEGPIELAAGAISLTVSVGVANFHEGMTADDLVAAADHAMYQIKRERARQFVPA